MTTITIRCYNILLIILFVSSSFAHQHSSNKEHHHVHSPENDHCIDATTLSVGSSVQGTTMLASSWEQADCRDLNNGNNWDDWDDAHAPAVWYAINGTGTGLRAYVCHQDFLEEIRVRLSVYKGGCKETECVSISSMNHLKHFCGGSGVGEIASWFARENEVYHILVQSSVHDKFPGPFRLEVEEADGMPISHDVCENALIVNGADDIAGVLGYPMSSIDFDVPVSCRRARQPDSPPTSGLWFQMEGTGETIIIGSGKCRFLNYKGDYSISVLTGDCNNLRCIGWHECDANNKPIVEVQTVKGQDYYILVEGTSEKDDLEFVVHFSQSSVARSQKHHIMGISTWILFATASCLVVTLPIFW